VSRPWPTWADAAAPIVVETRTKAASVVKRMAHSFEETCLNLFRVDRYFSPSTRKRSDKTRLYMYA
jgi:hypothetical protein